MSILVIDLKHWFPIIHISFIGFRAAFNVIDWEKPEQRVQSALNTHWFYNLKSCAVDNRVKVLLVNNISEVHSGDPLYYRFK